MKVWRVTAVCVLTLGFVLLASSDFQFIRHLGVLMAAAMLLCLLADLLLLPALIRIGYRTNQEGK